MHPVLFELGNFSVHGYGFMIMLGAFAGYFYLSRTGKKELGIEPEKVQNLAIYIILAAFIGGKLFFYFEKPGYYFSPPSNMLVNFRQGFVFYGSLLFVIPVAVWFFKKEKWPLWPLMDRLAITGLIVHAFGRMGCFMAGCCYGTPTESALGITFTDPEAQAKPLHEALHPTQLYEFTFLAFLLGTLLMLKRHGRFKGRLIFIYVIAYAIGRAIIEIFRGDLRRGFIIEDVLSHSQFISIILITVTLWIISKMKKRIAAATKSY